MLRIFTALLFLLFAIFIGLASMIWFAIEEQPLVVGASTEQLDNADAADALLKQIQQSTQNREQPSTLILLESQLESLQGVLHRAHNNVQGDVTIANGKGIARASLALNLNGKTRYINAEVSIVEGAGLPVESVRVGAVDLPGGLAKNLAAQGINLYTNSSSGSQALNSIKAISIAANSITVELHPLAPLFTELKQINTQSSSPEDLYLAQQTAVYLRVIAEYERKYGVKTRSLSDYVQIVFASAVQHSNVQNAVQNNRAAVLSLAIFAGHYRIGTFVGDVQENADKPLSPKHWPVLANRIDLTRHFTISAALQLLSEPSVSLAAGEFKELMDRARGGSGFSFIDLAADYAGVEFANMAINPDKAIIFQQLLAQKHNESFYFPAIAGLTEGYSKQAFTAKYKQVDSLEYKQVISRIQQRIQRLPLYSL